MNPLSSSCINCTVKIGLLQRKRLCSDCSHVFCSSCLPKEKGASKRKCGKCKIISASPLDRNTVTNLRVCDLKWYLKSTSVSMFACTEKSELVDLVMQNAPNVASSSSASYHYDGEALLASRLSNDASQKPATAAESFANADYSSQQPRNESSDSRSCPTSPRTAGFYRNNDSGSSLTINRGTFETITTSTLEDLKGPDEIAQLSARQLKLILVRNFVDYKGCCEKLELQDRVLRLWNQKRDRESKTVVDENVCKICWEAQIDCVMLECGHMATCTPCGKRMNECPICRQYVVRVVHTFKA